MIGALLLLALAAVPVRAGTDISKIEGGVTIFLPTLNEWRPVQNLPFGLRPGDRVKLKPLSRAEVYFQDGTWIRISEDAVLTVVQDDEGGAVVELDSGRLSASVKRLNDHVFEVRVPGAKVTLRADKASITITPKKVILLEVTSGLAVVEPAVGPAVQVPDDHSLEITPGKAPGLPVPLREVRQVLQKLPSAPPGMTRKYERKKVSADPGIGVPEPTGGKPAASPELGTESLGIAKPAPAAAEPSLGVESLGLEPALGNASLGIKDPTGKGGEPEPSLGGKSLGLKEPAAEPKPEPKKIKKAGGAGPYKPQNVSTDIGPPIDLKEYGVAPPKAPKKEPLGKLSATQAKPAEKKAPGEADDPDKPYKPRNVSTDIAPQIDLQEYGVAPPKPPRKEPVAKPSAAQAKPVEKKAPAAADTSNEPDNTSTDLSPLLDIPKQ